MELKVLIQIFKHVPTTQLTNQKPQNQNLQMSSYPQAH